MTTKQQEIEAMNKIKDIVAGLGADSYIGTAMDGVWEIMEENIKNDFAISVRDKLNSRDKYIASVRNERTKLQSEIQSVESALKMTEKSLKDANYEIERMKEVMDANERTMRDQSNQISSLHGENADVVAENARLKEEIIHLKAKLYDLLMKEVK